MRIALIIIMMLIIVAADIFYINILIKRVVSLFNFEIKKAGKITINVISVLMGIFSINVFSTFGIIILHILAISLLIEPLNILINTVIKKANKKWWNRIYKTVTIPIITTLVIFAIGYINIRNIIETDYTVYTTKNISQDYKVLMISDSHYGTIFQSEKLQELKSELDAQNADIVVLVGDVVDESTTAEQMKEVFSVFGDIKSKYGIYFVYGNHDMQKYDSSPNFTEDELKSTIEDNNITILEDELLTITDDITIVGRKDLDSSRKNVSDILSTASNESFILMLDHQPLEYKENASCGVDLILSGHTHAGQLFPAGYFITLLKTADLYYGYTTVDSMQAIVSSGIAGWGYPIRTQEHSEYVVINIEQQ